MKVQVERTALLNALAAVKNASRNPSQPILSNVAIVAHDAQADFTCCNLDLTIDRSIVATVEAEGAITVRASVLHDLVQNLQCESVSLLANAGELQVQGGQASYDLPAIGLDEFPPPVELEGGNAFTLSQSALRTALESVAFAKGSDQKRLILCSALLEFNGTASAVATDGRRLAVSQVADVLNQQPPVNIILPSESVAEVLRLLSSKEDATVTLSANDKLARFDMGDTIATTKVVPGEYPNYRKMIPATATAVNINRGALLYAARRVNLVSEVCRLEFDKNTLTILSGEPRKDVGGTAIETILVPDTAKRNVSLNAKFLVDALEAAKSDEVTFLNDGPLTVAQIKDTATPWYCIIAPIPPSK